MRPTRSHLAAAALATLAVACAHVRPKHGAGAIDPTAIGLDFVKHLVSGEFSAAVAPFDANMKAALPPSALAQLWATIQSEAGPFEAIERAEPSGVSHAGAFVRTLFTRKTLILKVYVDPAGKIDGFDYASADDASQWSPPPYASVTTLERPVAVGSAPALGGHLTLPAGPGPFPLAILIPGSGPTDEDETIGDNKPFKDLALGLAARGVAVLRYDKRTHVREGLPKLITVQDEYFGSLADALALARHMPEIDPHRIALVGHSEGGMLAPWLARQNPGVAGIAILAGPVRSPLDSVIDQFEQLRKLHPYSEAVAAKIEELRRERAHAESPELRPDEVLFNAPGSYWLSLRGYDPVATAAALDLPIFVAQGSRDYNVSPVEDYARWQAALRQKPTATLRLYPDLNHLFMPWGGTESVEDNLHPGHVSQAVVDDLAAWVAALPPRR